ncbi:hypothetical protein AB0O34_12680 [Sphaerisporangium sp. NPDC088356]|uniref:hypothetical protein n=1 Tax=Sphaerisporangium sp. NPDC088356 TaxID=3154871 RepID=UPI003438A972
MSRRASGHRVTASAERLDAPTRSVMLDIAIDGRAVPSRSAKQRVLPAVLISSANAPVAGQRLIDALCDDPPSSAPAFGRQPPR